MNRLRKQPGSLSKDTISRYSDSTLREWIRVTSEQLSTRELALALAEGCYSMRIETASIVVQKSGSGSKGYSKSSSKGYSGRGKSVDPDAAYYGGVDYTGRSLRKDYAQVSRSKKLKDRPMLIRLGTSPPNRLITTNGQSLRVVSPTKEIMAVQRRQREESPWSRMRQPTMGVKVTTELLGRVMMSRYVTR